MIKKLSILFILILLVGCADSPELQKQKAIDNYYTLREKYQAFEGLNKGDPGYKEVNQAYYDAYGHPMPPKLPPPPAIIGKVALDANFIKNTCTFFNKEKHKITKADYMVYKRQPYKYWVLGSDIKPTKEEVEIFNKGKLPTLIRYYKVQENTNRGGSMVTVISNIFLKDEYNVEGYEFNAPSYTIEIKAKAGNKYIKDNETIYKYMQLLYLGDYTYKTPHKDYFMNALGEQKSYTAYSYYTIPSYKKVYNSYINYLNLKDQLVDAIKSIQENEALNYHFKFSNLNKLENCLSIKNLETKWSK